MPKSILPTYNQATMIGRSCQAVFPELGEHTGTKSPLCPCFNPRKLLPAGVVGLPDKQVSVDTRDLESENHDDQTLSFVPLTEGTGVSHFVV